jgi:hypothetical protein
MGSSGVIDEEKTKRPTELADSRIKKMADFFMGITVVFWVRRI